MKNFIFLLLSIFSLNILQAQSITISEINYKSDATRNTGDWIEIRNFGASPIDISGWKLKDADTTNFIFPAGTNILPNGYLVVVADILGFTTEYPLVSNYIGTLPFSLGKNGDQINLYDVSGATILSFMYDDSLPWQRGARGYGRTLELNNYNSNTGLSLASNWHNGCMGGSPGGPEVICNDQIIFSEINYNSDSLFNQGEYVELHNMTNANINLTGFSMRDSRDTITNLFILPSGTILPANGYLVISNDISAFQSLNPGITNVIGNLPFSFSNGGETIRLFNALGRLQFSVSYEDTLTWPSSPDGDGFTLEINSGFGQMNSGSNWHAGCFGGSPGTPEILPCGIGIPESNTINFSVSPNPTDDFINIISENNIESVTIYNLQGQLIWNKNYKNQSNITLDNLNELNAGMYLLSINHNQFTKLIIE